MSTNSEQPNTDSFHRSVTSSQAPCGDKADEQPMYRHDCYTCVFLGTYESTDANCHGKFDLYYHPDARRIFETVIARFGRDGEYYSGMDFARPYTDIGGTRHEGIAPLVEAKRRAVARSLMKGQA